MSNTCIETIKIENGTIFNLDEHNHRCNHTRRELYQAEDTIDLTRYICPPKSKGVFRCRITYDKKIHNVEYFPYQTKIFQHFKLVDGGEIDYHFKYANRSLIEGLKTHAKGFDEIIILKNNYLTDTSIANIAFYDGSYWITPQDPLLRGTMREKLLKHHKLITKPIKTEDLKHFSHFALMNAMIGFQLQKNPTIHSNKEIICL